MTPSASTLSYGRLFHTVKSLFFNHVQTTKKHLFNQDCIFLLFCFCFSKTQRGLLFDPVPSIT